MSNKTELSKVKLLKGTFLVKVDKEEATTKSGLVVSSKQKQKRGEVVAINPWDTEGNEVEYSVGNKVLLNPNYDMTEVQLDGTTYELGSRENIVLILEE